MNPVLMTHESMQIDSIKIEGGRGKEPDEWTDEILQGHNIGIAGKMPHRPPGLPYHELDCCRAGTAYYRRIR